ncbi:MAG: YciI family protein [Pseudomonadota bacterium]
MQYMLLIYEAPGAWPEDERDAMMRDYFAYTEELRAAGAYVAGDALHPTETATSIRVRDGETVATDGPFAETREHLGGYYLIEVDSDEEARRWAAKIPSARVGTIEIRKVVVFDEVPA